MVSGHRPYWSPLLWSSLWFSLQPCHTSQELSLDFSNQRRSASPTYLEILVSLRNCLGICVDKDRAPKCKLKLTNPESAQTQVWHAGLLLNVTWNKKVGDLYLDSHLIYANPIRPREDKSNWNMWLQFLLPARTEFPWLPGQSISPEKGLEYDDKSISRQTEMNSLSAKLFNGQDLATCPELSVRQQSEYSSLWESLLQINSWNWSDVPA